MPHNHSTTKTMEMETCPGVNVVLRKMTEGRRIELRRLINEPNRRIREILREQSKIEEQPEDVRDMAKLLELQDEFDGLMIEKVNPSWIQWGVKQINGLEVDGKPLSVDDWPEWPSALFDEVLTAVRAEVELNGVERKNLKLPTTSGGPTDLTRKDSTAASAASAATGTKGTADSISRTN